MSQRDEIADIIRAMEDSEQTWGECADAILDLLEPDDAMVEAGARAMYAENSLYRYGDKHKPAEQVLFDNLSDSQLQFLRAMARTVVTAALRAAKEGK